MGASSESVERARKLLGFWSWLIDPAEGGGRRRWLTWHLVGHLFLGFVLASRFSGELSERARSVILPLAGVLVGLTFAWAATAINIVSTPEFRRAMMGSKAGVRGTANYFQFAILAVLSTTVLWAIVGLGPYNSFSGWDPASVNIWAARLLFAYTSFAIRECWGAINVTRLSLLSFNVVREIDESEAAASLGARLPNEATRTHVDTHS